MKATKYILISIIIILSFLYIKTQQYSPNGDIIPWEDLEAITLKSELKAESRKNEITVSINLNKEEFSVGEKINLIVSLKNHSDGDIVIRRLDKMPIMGNETTNILGLKFIIKSNSTGEILEGNDFFTQGFIQESFPTPDSFIALPRFGKQISHFELLSIFPSITVGDYSIQLIYSSSYFGAVKNDGINSEFINYDAWIGTKSSNTLTFRVIP
ncbi:MAG: hypothetical protein KF758_05495 [Anaerolineales bacterium]|nr:hypothetical protein [Anaerolineales bacterium]MBX3036350.1 hypothetical protein [Anaerolineales bacterium]